MLEPFSWDKSFEANIARLLREPLSERESLYIRDKVYDVIIGISFVTWFSVDGINGSYRQLYTLESRRLKWNAMQQSSPTVHKGEMLTIFGSHLSLSFRALCFLQSDVSHVLPILTKQIFQSNQQLVNNKVSSICGRAYLLVINSCCSNFRFSIFISSLGW